MSCKGDFQAYLLAWSGDYCKTLPFISESFIWSFHCNPLKLRLRVKFGGKSVDNVTFIDIDLPLPVFDKRILEKIADLFISGESHSSSTLPPCWSCLPALALPDGAHQHDEDSSFFLLPSKETPSETVFGISCYRQIETKKLKVKDKDVTRDTVQKSVVLISTKPVFGVLKVLYSVIQIFSLFSYFVRTYLVFVQRKL